MQPKFSRICKISTIRQIWRNFSSSDRRQETSFAKLWSIYNEAKIANGFLPAPPSMNPKAVYCNNELHMSEIEACGFDYDYTLAIYKKPVNTMIYELALRLLIENFKYPAAIFEMDYDPTFAIRGLHYDVARGLILKLDAFSHIQLGTVYRGKYQLSNEEIIEKYGGIYVPLRPVEEERGFGSMRQLMDFFSLPELGLLLNVTEYFQQNGMEWDADSLFQDVQNAVRSVHVTGQLYESVGNNVEKYC